jgi:hypothetical protein
VDSTGGLTTILTDETDDLNLFLDGNPAGLVLLNTRDRVDASGQWFYQDQEGPWGSNKQQTFTTIPRSTDTAIKYEGLMAFPDPHWAFQVLGDFLSTQGVPAAAYSSDTYTSSQYRAMVRGAYAFSFGAVGFEILDIQSDKSYDPGLYWPASVYPYVGLASGNNGQNQFLLKTGFLTTFPGVADSQAPRWQAGGYVVTQLGSSLQNQTLNLFYLNTSPFAVNQVTTTTGYFGWGAELLYELPSEVKIRFSASLVNSDSDFEQTVPFTSILFGNLTKYHASQFGSMDVGGAFKLSLPFSGEERLKLGGSVDGYFYNMDLLRLAGTVYDNSNRQQIATRFGIGIESLKEYTMGVQWRSMTYVKNDNSINPAGTTSSIVDSDYDLYQVAFGGERWLSPTLAFRMGLVLEDDVYSSLSSDTLTTSINLGAGLEQAFGRVDFRFQLGQTADQNNSSNTIGLIEAQLSGTIFL